MKKIIVAVLFLFLGLNLFRSPVFAQVDIYSNQTPSWTPQESINNSRTANVISRFRYYRLLAPLTGTIPQVVEVALPKGSSVNNSDYAIVEDETTTLQSFELNSKVQEVPFRIIDVSGNKNEAELKGLAERSMYTFVQFHVVENQATSKATLRYIYDSPITTDTLVVNHDDLSDLPVTISIKITDPGREEIVITKKAYSQDSLRFPMRTASNWEVTLDYTQPVRIYGMFFNDSQASLKTQHSIRFLMRPGSPYLLFSGRDGLVDMPYLESGDYSAVTDVTTLSLPAELPNPSYTPADEDNDGITDGADNCQHTSNKDQKDVNKNGIGDACEDFDKDGIVNAVDNCPDHPNLSQQDADGDKIGDHCDGAESRITERLSFLPWLGIALGFGVVIAIFAITVKKPPNQSQNEKK